MTTFDPDRAATMLAELWRSGHQVQELPPEIRPRSIDEGYYVQDRLVRLLGERVAGWKLGVGSHKGKRDSGIGRSIAGRVLTSHLHRSGDAIDLPNAAPVTVEFEIAFVLGRDVRPDETIDDPLSVVGKTLAAFELVLSRFVDRRAVGWPSFAADNGAFQALVLGEALDPGTLSSIPASLVIEVNGQERARAATGEDETVPHDALADLLAIARERGMLLPNGSIISTGTVSVPFTITGASRVKARYLGGELAFETRM